MADFNQSYIGHPRVLNNLIGSPANDPPDHPHVLSDPYTCLPGEMNRQAYRPKPDLPQWEPPQVLSGTEQSHREDQVMDEDPQPQPHLIELKGNDVHPLPFVPNPEYSLMEQLTAVADAIEDPESSWSDKANWGAPTKLGRMNITKYKPIEQEKGLSHVHIGQDTDMPSDEDTYLTPSVKALTKVLSEEELKEILEETVHKPVLENVLDADYVQYLDDAILGGDTFYEPMGKYRPSSALLNSSVGLMATAPPDPKDQSYGAPMPSASGRDQANRPPIPAPRRQGQMQQQQNQQVDMNDQIYDIAYQGLPRPNTQADIEAARLANRPIPAPRRKGQMQQQQNQQVDVNDQIYDIAYGGFQTDVEGQMQQHQNEQVDTFYIPMGNNRPAPCGQGQMQQHKGPSSAVLNPFPELMSSTSGRDQANRPPMPAPRRQGQMKQQQNQQVDMNDPIYSIPYQGLPRPTTQADIEAARLAKLAKRPPMPAPHGQGQMQQQQDLNYARPGDYAMPDARVYQNSSKSQTSDTYESPVHSGPSGSGTYLKLSNTHETQNDSNFFDDSQTYEESILEKPEMPWSKADPGYEQFVEIEEAVEPIESSDEESDHVEDETLQKVNMKSYEDYYAKFNDLEKPQDLVETVDGVDKIIRTKTPWSSVMRTERQPYSLELIQDIEEDTKPTDSETSTVIAQEDIPKCMCFNLDHEHCWKNIEKNYDEPPVFRDDLLKKTASNTSQNKDVNVKKTCSWLACFSSNTLDPDNEPVTVTKTSSNSSFKEDGENIGKKSTSKMSNPEDDRQVTKTSSSKISNPQDDRKVTKTSSSKISNPQDDRKADKKASSKTSTQDNNKVVKSSSSRISNPQDNRVASDSTQKIESKISVKSNVTDNAEEKHTCMGCGWFPCKPCLRGSITEIEVEETDLEVEPSLESLPEPEPEPEPEEPSPSPPPESEPSTLCEIVSEEVLPEVPGPDVEFLKDTFEPEEIDLDEYDKIKTPYMHDNEYIENCYWTKCRYCTLNFDDTRQPILLTCWHLICEPCYEFIIEHIEEGDFFACPECSEPHHVFPCGIPIANRVQFPLRMLEYNSKIKDLEDVPLCDLSDTKEPEGREEHELVKWLCGDCHKQLCQACMMVHYECTKHVYVSFKQCHEAFIRKSISQKLYFCLDHPNESLENFCTDCSMLACKKCVTSTHQNHEMSLLDCFIQPQRNAVAYTLAHAYPAAIKMIDKYMLHLRTRKSSLERELAQINFIVTSKATQARKMIDQLARILVGNLREKVGYVTQENEDHIIECCAEYTHLMQMQNLIQFVVDFALDDEMPYYAILFEKFYNNMFDYQTALPKACYMFTLEVACTGAMTVDFGLDVGPTKLKHCLNVFDSPIESIAMHDEVMILVSPILQGVERSKVRVLCSDFTMFKDYGNLIKQQAPCVSRVCYANIDGTVYLVLLNRGECSNCRGEIIEYSIIPGCNNDRYYIKLIDIEKGDVKVIKRDVGFSPVAIANACKFGLAYTTNRFDTFDAALVVQNPDGPPCPVFTNEDNPDHDFIQPEYMCCNSNGDFIVTDKQTHRLFIISCQGEIINVVKFDLSDALSTPDFPNGVCVDANDNIYVAISNDNIIERYTPDGSESEVFLDKVDGLEQPQCILIQDELLYVGTRTGKLLIYSIR